MIAVQAVYGCEFSLSLDMAVGLITQSCVAVTECHLGFFEEPAPETLDHLKTCGFERLSDEDREVLLMEFDDDH